jgi:hypothetical protein
LKNIPLPTLEDIVVFDVDERAVLISKAGKELVLNASHYYPGSKIYSKTYKETRNGLVWDYSKVLSLVGLGAFRHIYEG